MDISSIVILVIVGVGGVMLKTFYDQGKAALAIFPDIKTVTVVYRDKTALGYSMKSWKTKVGGASRSLDIIVTDKELWLRSVLLLAGITRQHDLVHRVPLHRIGSAKESKEGIVLSFKTEKGEAKQIVINTRDKQEFLKSIGK